MQIHSNLRVPEKAKFFRFHVLSKPQPGATSDTGSRWGNARTILASWVVSASWPFLTATTDMRFHFPIMFRLSLTLIFITSLVRCRHSAVLQGAASPQQGCELTKPCLNHNKGYKFKENWYGFSRFRQWRLQLHSSSSRALFRAG